MNLKQLNYICTVVRVGFNISDASELLLASQPGVSTQIKLLEDELGTKIFVRHGKRITGLTAAGEDILRLAEEALVKINAIKNVGKEHLDEKSGTLSIATTHTQARYVLPPVITQFANLFPDVQLRIHQGNPVQISEMTIQGEADIAIATEAIADYDKLLMLPVYRWNRYVVAKPEHSIFDSNCLSLHDIARYPIITYDYAFTGRSSINNAFQEAGLEPNIVLTAMDSDVIKHYVELGLGIGILAHMAFDQDHELKLKCRDVSHLFADSVTNIGIRRGSYLRGYMYQFIELFAPELTKDVIDGAIGGKEVPAPAKR